MLDIDVIRIIHKNDESVIDTPFPSIEVAVLMFKQTHRHRGLLLAEVERLRDRVEKLESQLDASEAMLKALVV